MLFWNQSRPDDKNVIHLIPPLRYLPETGQGTEGESMDITRSFDRFIRGDHHWNRVMAPLLLIMVAAVFVLVYATGGIKYVYSHSMYIPVLLSGFVFGVKGGVVVGLIGGVALGPFMPIDVLTGERQDTLNWLYRSGFFVLIGALSGLASDSVKSYMRHLDWVSRHDAASGLPNRNALFDDLHMIGEKKFLLGDMFLTVISVANNIELRSAFGFEVMEEVVAGLAERINREGRQDVVVYRVDTGQLAVLVGGGATTESGSFFSGLASMARTPFLFNEVLIHADFRIGYVRVKPGVKQPADCLREAEAALVVAYEKAQDWVIYHPDISATARENMSLLGELTHAVKNGALSLHYQPKVEMSDGEVHGVEALMRWQHPEKGNIPPGVFIPRAEQSTLIQLITRFALEQAMAQMVRWRRVGIHLPVAVNISTRNLLQPGFTDMVLELLENHGLPAGLLELEVTEGALMMDVNRTIGELTRLADAGVVISIDDFGTGYSSLQYLHQLPVSKIKVDQFFIRRLASDVQAAHILDAALMLGHKMGMKVIAEGVETADIYNTLVGAGCDVAQGYIISRPVQAQQMESWYRSCGGRFSLSAA